MCNIPLFLTIALFFGKVSCNDVYNNSSTSNKTDDSGQMQETKIDTVTRNEIAFINGTSDTSKEDFAWSVSQGNFLILGNYGGRAERIIAFNNSREKVNEFIIEENNPNLSLETQFQVVGKNEIGGKIYNVESISKKEAELFIGI